MNTDNRTARNLLDVRIILAVLWAAEVLSSLNGDTYRLSDSVALRSLLENTGSIKATPELLLVMSMILYAVIILAFWVLGFVLQSAGYEFVWSTAQLVFVLLVVWYAWKWPKQEA